MMSSAILYKNSTHLTYYRLKWLIKDTIEEREDIQKEQKEKKRTNNIKNKERKVKQTKKQTKHKQKHVRFKRRWR